MTTGPQHAVIMDQPLTWAPAAVFLPPGLDSSSFPRPKLTLKDAPEDFDGHKRCADPSSPRGSHQPSKRGVTRGCRSFAGVVVIDRTTAEMHLPESHSDFPPA